MKQKKFTKKKILFVILVIVIGIIMANIIHIRQEWRAEYNNYIKEYETMQTDIRNEEKTIHKFQKTETTNEDELYNLMKEYRKQLTENDDTEIFRKVFDKVFPQESYFKTNREESFVTIYALLELYPEIKEYKNTSDLLMKINKNINDLRNIVENYNENINEYVQLIDTINTTDYVTHSIRHRVPQNTFNYYYVD